MSAGRVVAAPGRSARRPAHSAVLIRVGEPRSVVPLEAKLIPIGSRGARHGFPPVGDEIVSKRSKCSACPRIDFQRLAVLPRKVPYWKQGRNAERSVVPLLPRVELRFHVAAPERDRALLWWRSRHDLGGTDQAPERRVP